MTRIRTRATREGNRGLRTWLHLGPLTTRTETYIASGARHAGIGLRTDYAANAETLHKRHGHAITRALRASERDDHTREGR